MESAGAIENREIIWKVFGIPVHGTITAPKDHDVHPAVVFLAGSGPTDRNWCSPILPGSNGTAKILAEKLARRGYVTLRYDKLGSGPHVSENLSKFAGRLSMSTFVDELRGGIETLALQKNVDSSKLYALTNSEGAIHAVNYQLETKRTGFRGLVLTGAPGRAIGEVARTQFLNQSKSLPDVEAVLKHYDRAVEDFLAGRSIVIDPSLPKGFEQLFRSLESPFNLPFSRELWTYNLSEYIKQVTDPILVLIGKKDVQVDWQLDGKPLEDALLQNTQALVAYPENANHVLKHEELPREKLSPEYVGARYNADDAQLDNETANIIFKWLAKQDTKASI
jgi:uncharacterized protein